MTKSICTLAPSKSSDNVELSSSVDGESYCQVSSESPQHNPLSRHTRLIWSNEPPFSKCYERRCTSISPIFHVRFYVISQTVLKKAVTLTLKTLDICSLLSPLKSIYSRWRLELGFLFISGAVMARFVRSRLTCFYCGRLSSQKKTPGLECFRCERCEAENYLDEVSTEGNISSTPNRICLSIREADRDISEWRNH